MKSSPGDLVAQGLLSPVVPKGVCHGQGALQGAGVLGCVCPALSPCRSTC